MLCLGRRQKRSDVLIRRLLRGKDAFFEEALADKLFHVLPKALVVDGFVPFIVAVETILFCSEKCRIVPDWSRAYDPWLVLDGIGDLIDGEPERSKVLCQLEGSEQIQ